MNAPKKKLYIKTYGCQMNVADSEQMALLLAPEYEPTSRPEEADLYLINTCSIRRKSEEKVRSLIGRLRGLKRRRPQMLLGVGGCVAQQEGPRLLDKAPQVDLIFGTEGFYRLPQLISQRLARGKPVVDIAITGTDYYLCRQPALPAMRKLVTIMQGCNNFCTYCVVPYVRGRERSRPAAAIVAEVAAFVAQGGKEVTLLGQNVNSYGRGLANAVSFPELLRRLSRLEGLLRLRFTTSHPRDLSEELIACFGELAPLCEHIHLPVQAGSNRILARMNRGYTREEYLAKVRRLRQVCPGIAITTDLIVGFPGETEADFAATLDLMQEVAFDHAFYFKYSPRPQTVAAGLPDQVPAEVKGERLTRLQALQEELTLASHRRLLGSIQEVLVEGTSRQGGGQLAGRLRTNQVVNFMGPTTLLGRLVQVKIDQAGRHSLGGRLWPAVSSQTESGS